MAVISKTNLKEYFNKGDKPTEAQFENLIDSFMHAESSEFVNITASNTIDTLNLISISSSLGFIQPSGSTFNIIVSGNLVPVPDNDSFTSSFSLGSSTAAWKDLFVSEDSIKFIRQSGSGESEILASIQIDKDSGLSEAVGTTDVLKIQHPDGRRMDLETGHIQIGKDRGRGFEFSNPGSSIGAGNIYGKFQNYLGSGKGQQLLMRPESETLTMLGRKYKTHLFNAQGGGSVTFALRNMDGDRNGFFRIEKDTTVAGFGTPLLEVHEDKHTTFFGTDSILTVEGTIESTGGTFTGGNTVIEEAVTVQPGIISQSINIGTATSPSTLEMIGVGDDNSIKIADAIYKQVTEITFPFNGLNTASLQDVTLPASGAIYFALRDGTFHTFAFGNSTFEKPNSQISGSITTASIANGIQTAVGTLPSTVEATGVSTGEQIAGVMSTAINSTNGFSTVQNINKVIVTLDTPGPVIAASTTFPSATSSLSTTTVGRGAEVRVHDGSTFRIISSQPDVTVNTSDDTITISNGGGDETVFSTGQFGTNPQYIPNHLVVPSNQVAVWYGPIYIGRFTLNPFGSDFDPDGAGVLNMDSAGQGDNASLRIHNGAQIKVQAF